MGLYLNLKMFNCIVLYITMWNILHIYYVYDTRKESTFLKTPWVYFSQIIISSSDTLSIFLSQNHLLNHQQLLLFSLVFYVQVVLFFQLHLMSKYLMVTRNFWYFERRMFYFIQKLTFIILLGSGYLMVIVEPSGYTNSVG